MSFNRYYQGELSALRQLGRRFCERNPALAPFLGDAGQDPDVERLLEGFAFLTGRLRQKLDDQLPELSHSLMHLLWPNYMRPLPSFSMLQFDPLKRTGPAIRVERDTVFGKSTLFRNTDHKVFLPAFYLQPFFLGAFMGCVASIAMFTVVNAIAVSNGSTNFYSGIP